MADQATLKSFIVLFVIYVLVDAFWQLVLSLPLWESQVRRLTGREMTIGRWSTLFTNALIVLGLNYLAFTLINSGRLVQDSVLYGLIFGLTVFGSFNFNNVATLPGYNIALGLVDTFWGVLVSVISLYFAGAFLL